ncbi:MAG: tetratricopeptide repeat protein [Gammaproteobacteria bacterium]
MSAPPNRQLEQLQALEREADQARAQQQTARALNLYIQLSLRAPNHWPAYYWIGRLMSDINRPVAALTALRRAAAIAPEQSGVLVAMALAFNINGEHSQAVDVLRRAVALDPANLHARFNLAEMLLRMNEIEEALTRFDDIVEGPQDADNIRAISRWLRAVARLTLGDYQAAWDDYEARVDHPTTTFPTLEGELWCGQPLQGKRVFLAYEQRFGDVIQFSRFVPRLTEQGATVILQTPHELLRLFESLGQGTELIEYKDAKPAYDYCQLVTSIPAVMNYAREDVWRGPYLDTQPEVTTRPLPMRPGTRLKVGLVWAGKPIPNRSIPLKQLAPLLRQRDVSFYSFQLGEEREQAKALGVDWLIHDLSDRITDFHDSSCLMKQMDLMITIDTAAAHQAGAMGLPVWLLLIYYSDWRWGAYRDDHTAWYPNTRIFRQHEMDSWRQLSRDLDTAFERWIDEKVAE